MSACLYWLLQSAKIKSKLLSGSGKLKPYNFAKIRQVCGKTKTSCVQTAQLESSDREQMCIDYVSIHSKHTCMQESWGDKILKNVSHYGVESCSQMVILGRFWPLHMQKSKKEHSNSLIREYFDSYP